MHRYMHIDISKILLCIFMCILTTLAHCISNCTVLFSQNILLDLLYLSLLSQHIVLYSIVPQLATIPYIIYILVQLQLYILVVVIMVFRYTNIYL